MTELLTKDAIFALNDLLFEDVEIPEWNGRLRVRGMTAAQRDAYEQSLIDARSDARGRTKVEANFTNAKARLAVQCVIDANGQRVFTDAEAAALGQKSASAVNRIAQVAQRLSGMSKEDLDDLEKNSVPAQPADSPSD